MRDGAHRSGVQLAHHVFGLPVAGLTADGTVPVRILRRLVRPVHHMHLQPQMSTLYLKESMRHAAHVNAEVHAQDDLIFNEQHLDRPASTGEELIQP